MILFDVECEALFEAIMYKKAVVSLHHSSLLPGPTELIVV